MIRLYSNEKVKFPNGPGMRQALAYKILDIILLISLRIGPEQTRIELTYLLRVFFDGFNQVKSTLQQSPSINQSPSVRQAETSVSSIRTRSAFKARTSIVSFDQTGVRRFVATNQSTDLNNSAANNSAAAANKDQNLLDNSTNELNDSFDEYLKFSYDQSTNEIVGSSLKAANVIGSKNFSSPETSRYRGSNFGILEQPENNNDGD